MLVFVHAHAYMHATVDVAAQQKRIVWNVIPSALPLTLAPLPDARVRVREEVRQKSGPLFVQPFSDVNKGPLHCTSVCYPLLFFCKPFPLLFWHFITTWMAWCDFMTKISSSCTDSVFTNVYLSSRQLRDTTYPNINYGFIQTREELCLFWNKCYSHRGASNPSRSCSALFLIPSMPSVSAKFRRTACSHVTCRMRLMEPILLGLLVYSNTTNINI